MNEDELGNNYFQKSVLLLKSLQKQVLTALTAITSIVISIACDSLKYLVDVKQVLQKQIMIN